MTAETGRKDFLDELKAMKERMEDIFTRSFDPEADRQDRGRRQDDWVPLSDIVDSGKELVYSLDLPGVMEHDIQVECKDDRLWISGLRKDDLPEGESVRIERPKGSFSRVFKFPCPVDEEAIQAEFKKGVLRVSVPKSSPGCRARRIEVREVE
ncbi:MAG: Hsp20/alpha crystallin family protein [Deltaproteobacteria bacterium]|jgi:HSP20 family protein|nr:Hsp20/alpha crystallin family protein [Deltaproteobacteria bacterium]MDA8305476.1 Hsp20/alpha crystallin family protein [Deltaproteobacteria bacterium]